jgi:hypothetical protein
MNKLRKLNPLRTRLVILTVLVSVVACAPLLSRAGTTSTTLSIVNNSSHEIRHVYLSAPDSNNWGADQLGSSVIAAGGGSVSLTVNCNGASIKVIAEDEEGCFFYQIVSCDNTASWTIAANAARDCGSGN